MSRIARIVSGGQTGADRAALDFALARSIPHGGWCPRGRWAEDGPIAARYQLVETPEADPAQRTEWNVRDAEATVLFSLGSRLAGGSKQTADFACQYCKPWLHLTAEQGDGVAAEKLREFLAQQRIQVLNIAGPRASEEPGIGKFVTRVLTAAVDRPASPRHVAGQSRLMKNQTQADRIQVVEGDITRQEVEAIVNAANTTLLGGGGVDGAIHRAAGPALVEECRKLGGCPTGEARITRGYRLPAKWVIHTVGPVWRDGTRGEEDLLASCYRNSLALAEQHGIRTLAFPSISTGAYGFPMERAARIAVREVKAFLARNPSVENVLLVCFGRNAAEVYERAVREAGGTAQS